MAINPNQSKEASTTALFKGADGMYDLIFAGVGENNGQSAFKVLVNNKEVGTFSTPLTKSSFEEGVQYNDLWENISLKKEDKITVIGKVGSKDGEYSRARWSGIIFAPMTKGKDVLELVKNISTKQNVGQEAVISGNADETEKEAEQPKEMSKNGKAEVNISGASEGVKWRAHLSPDKTGKWDYKISFLEGAMVATADMPCMKALKPYNGIEGSFVVGPNVKSGRDFRAKGRLEYVGKHYLQFKGTGEYFYKAGADAPETLLAYEDFDNTIGMKPNVSRKNSMHI